MKRKSIGCWSMMKGCRNSSSFSWEKSENDPIFMNRKSTSNVGQWWKIDKTHPATHVAAVDKNFKMISCWWREKVHGMLVNDEILLKLSLLLTEILKWSHFDDEKKYIGCSSMMNDWWNSPFFWWSILKWSLFDEEKKYIGCQSMMKDCWNSSSCWSCCWEHYKMISFCWREKVHVMLVDDGRFFKFMLLRSNLNWSHFDEEKKYMGCW